MNKPERVRLWITINHNPVLWDMVMTEKEDNILIRLEPPSFLAQPGHIALGGAV